MTYYFTVSYDEIKDEFYGFVDKGKDDKSCVFVIGDTKEMCDLIQTGVMEHIDDVDGLTSFLQAQDYLQQDDFILINETVLE
jgi:hypothetical protein